MRWKNSTAAGGWGILDRNVKGVKIKVAASERPFSHFFPMCDRLCFWNWHFDKNLPEKDSRVWTLFIHSTHCFLSLSICTNKRSTMNKDRLTFWQGISQHLRVPETVLYAFRPSLGDILSSILWPLASNWCPFQFSGLSCCWLVLLEKHSLYIWNTLEQQHCEIPWLHAEHIDTQSEPLWNVTERQYVSKVPCCFLTQIPSGVERCRYVAVCAARSLTYWAAAQCCGSARMMYGGNACRIFRDPRDAADWHWGCSGPGEPGRCGPQAPRVRTSRWMVQIDSASRGLGLIQPRCWVTLVPSMDWLADCRTLSDTFQDFVNRPSFLNSSCKYELLIHSCGTPLNPQRNSLSSIK